MLVVAFIPARYGSTRLDAKPLKEIKGKPMVQWVYERVKRAKTVQGVAVATDDERIVRAVEAFGGKAVMTPGCCLTGTERVAEAARSLEADIVVNVQGDEPLIEPDLIDSVVLPMLADPSIDIGTAKTKLTDPAELLNPNVVKVVTDKDGFALYFSRSAIPYSTRYFEEGSAQVYKHLGIYVYRKDALLKLSALKQTGLELSESLEQLRALENGMRIKVVETPYTSVAVDTQEDLDRVRKMAENL
ncbi:MAG: 3-deoxy-manno-octulosonate cytidylyltransferase [Thermodesulfobacteriota bacterium]